MIEIRDVEIFELIRSAAKLPENVFINASSRFEQDLGVDSLDLVGVLLEIQDTYGFEWSDAEISSINSVKDVTDLMVGHGLKTIAA